MDMVNYWKKVPRADKKSLKMLSSESPEAYQALVDWCADQDVPPRQVQVAFTVVPNQDPEGTYSDEDEEDLAKKDPQGKMEAEDLLGPSVTGDQDLFLYHPGFDLLARFDEEDRIFYTVNY
jgi:hypothetical protein